MFSHVMVGTNDLEKSKSFYDPLMATLNVPPSFVDGHRMFYMSKSGVFAVSAPIDGQPACHANGGTTCEEPPGVRAGGMGKMYLAYLRDPDGNKLCAMHRMPA